MVETGGPDALSVRRVAQQAGTTTRAVYTLFESKEGLLVALGTRAFEILGSSVADSPRTEDPVADLVNVMVKLLSFLLAHSASTHTRETLIEKVWDSGFCGDRKTVNVHVRWLREKFTDRVPFEISAVRGIGYRLDRLPVAGRDNEIVTAGAGLT
jgi:AcrR family transcriptional regulator